MSKVLSIYNERAFCEIVLPSVTNTEYSYVLDADMFQLAENIILDFECVQNKWFIRKLSDNAVVNRTDSAPDEGGALANNARYGIKTSKSEYLTLLVEDRDNPLSVYRKFILNPNQTISVGAGKDHTIYYRYPEDESIKSYVSGHHCSIYYDGANAYLEDTSANGTFVNNRRVIGKSKLSYGDNIRVFGLSIVYLNGIIAVNSPRGMAINLKEASIPVLEEAEEKGNLDGNSNKHIFHRAPRSIPGMDSETITIDPPPNPKEPTRQPLILQIGPAVTMTIPMLLGSCLAVVAYSSSGTSSSMLMYTGIITALGSAIIGAFWAIINVRYSKKSQIEEEKRRLEKYGHYLVAKQAQVERVYHADCEALLEKYISSEQIANYDHQNEKLWNRNFNHSDVLTYRLGIGDVPFPAFIDVPKEKFTMIDDDLAEKPRKIKEQFMYMHNVPICIDLKENSLTGVIGASNSWSQIIRNLIVQIAGNNSYTDVKIAFVYDESKISNAGVWEFVKWLPHVWSEDKKIRYFATNKNEAGEVFYSISQTLRTRSEEEQTGILPYYVLFVLNKELLEGELISKYISDTSENIGLSTIIVSEYYEGLPNICEFIIENNRRFAGVYSTTNENSQKCAVIFDRLDEQKAMIFAKRLANIEVSETESGGEIPSSISFFDMYGIAKPEELHAAERWRRSKTQETMKALIGVKSGGAPCYLDVHERYHGPHGLVAGTTGSGKSETLQTYILSLALNYSPDDVGFFIIDYKGGGMANLFEGLPHMIGAISNLSGNQVKRAMVSIKSENKRRQRVFSDYGVNNINAYTALYKAGDAKDPIPHMFIIIDEFAELKREEPDFMRELVSVAQVGRSLGVHLILATQKPAGTVDDNIWSNSKFRLCLRVQDRQDSMDMLHRTDAAYLTQAGRGYLQVGNDELFELFQSGYSGAVYDEALGNKKLIVAQMLDPVGKVDLIGNHFKIQYQEEAKHNWLKLVCEAVEYADVNIDLKKQESTESEEFLEKIYAYIEKNGADYRRSPYNDARLKDFLRLYRHAEAQNKDEKIKQIIAAAAMRGLKLPEKREKSQLEAVEEYLTGVASENHYTHAFQLWMPVLPDNLLLTQIDGYQDLAIRDRIRPSKEAHWSLSVIIGKGDDPENQNQMPIYVNFADNGHHLICGTVSTGKSTFLQTLVYALLNKYTSEEMNLYILDFSSKLLTVFEGAKQVGGIITDSEEDLEKTAKFFTMMSAIMSERKVLLASTNYRDYVEHSHKKLPAIIIVIDNYAAFKEKTGEKYEEIIKQMAKEGLSFGIYLIMSSAGFGMAEVPNRLAENFRTTISLELSDIYQYGEVMRVVRVPLYPESNVKGRGLVFYGERIIEFQTALACEGESNFARNDNIRKRIREINDIDPTKGAKKIPVIPQKPVWEEYIQEEDYHTLLGSSNLLPNGYDAETAALSSIDLTSMLTYVVSGTKKSGKSTYMKNMISAAVDKECEVCIIEIGSTEFKQISEARGCRYISDGQGIYDFARDRLLKEAGIRGPKKTECMNRHLEDEDFFAAMSEYGKIFVFIPNVMGFLTELRNSASPAVNAANVYETLVGDRGWHYNIFFVVEMSDSDAADAMGYKFMSSFKENGRGIRFGGKYLSQKLFSYQNVHYKLQDVALKPGTGTLPSEEQTARLRQVVVPNYRG